ncbi:hypothetical protein OsJ_17171 [Oryza sativa Japonica Group]|uniref:Uncharacterized protein n=1 Tax=Oryza sativa subsp. japonica TaxID=39947 RepID=B9FHE9_ORYSJ|nr:hypothetical protein OsJ_17171 [Oryza sativa Japonica Group]
MAEPPSQSPAQTPPQAAQQQQQGPGKTPRNDIMACVAPLKAALLPCLPARDLQARRRSLQSSHEITWDFSDIDPAVSPSLLPLPPSFPRVDVERHARDFMEAAKKLQSYFISLQREDRPSTEEMLRKNLDEKLNCLSELLILGKAAAAKSSLKHALGWDIAIMEEELKTKSELIDKHKKLIEGWQKELKDQLGKHVTELERV